MKRRFLSSMLLAVMLCGLWSCGDNLDPLDDGNHRFEHQTKKHEMKTIRMVFGGDFIMESEEPLLRADDGDKYTAINVFRTEKDVPGAKEERYAHGLFKNKDKVQIDVVTGFTYRFEATIVIDKEDKVYVYEGGYQQPFKRNTTQNFTGTPQSYSQKSLDEFLYTTYDAAGKLVEDRNRNYFVQLESGTAFIDAGSNSSDHYRYADVSYPRVKRFLGSVDTFDPSISDSVEIPMDYKCFGLKFEVINLPGDGYLTVEDVTLKNGIAKKDYKELLLFPKSLTLNNDSKVWEGVYSINNLNGTDKFTLEFTWHKGGNVTEKYKSEFTVSPKMKKVLRLNVTGSPNYEVKGNITFKMDSEELDDDVETIGPVS